MTKDELRARGLAARSLGGDPDALTENLKRALLPYAGRTLAGYWPMRGEPDPRPAMESYDGPLCLPVVTGKAVPLLFRLWDGAELTPGVYGTSHPADSCPEVEPQVLIVPLVGFDSNLNRIGYGGGFYDRTLEKLRQKRPTVAVGLAWESQLLPPIPVDPYDQRLDILITERCVRNAP